MASSWTPQTCLSGLATIGFVMHAIQMGLTLVLSVHAFAVACLSPSWRCFPGCSTIAAWAASAGARSLQYSTAAARAAGAAFSPDGTVEAGGPAEMSELAMMSSLLKPPMLPGYGREEGPRAP